MTRAAQVVLATAEFDRDLAALTDGLGFRIDAIHPADAPATAVVSGYGVRLRLERSATGAPLTLRLLTDERTGSDVLPGGSTVEFHPFTTTFALPADRPELSIVPAGGGFHAGRAGMRYRDLLPSRWGGRFIVSHITIPDGGPVPDYVHFHKVRFQMIFVRAGWVRLVYEDQGDPFVLHAGDCVLQPPEIRHRVLECSPGLEVIEIGCPAEHETIADWALPLPTPGHSPDREFSGQRFVRHTAEGAPWEPWRLAGWEHRDSGIEAATGGLAGARVARPTDAAPDPTGPLAIDSELALLVVLAGAVTFESETTGGVALDAGAAVAVPGGLAHRLLAPSADCELLDVTLPARPSASAPPPGSRSRPGC